jgi:5-methylthioadenosine/S-adenosylhomocysteine deaminase
MSGSILTAELVMTMDGANRILEHGAIAIDGDRIVMVDSLNAVLENYPNWSVRRLPNRLLMPGLVNAHLHSGILRGTAEGLPVWDWLRLYIDPMHRVLTPREAAAASWLCYAEAVLSGTTVVVDMWRFMDGDR